MDILCSEESGRKGKGWETAENGRFLPQFIEAFRAIYNIITEIYLL